MDLNLRSPSFLSVKNSRPSSAKPSPKPQRTMYKPIPTNELLKSFNMYHPSDKPTTLKKLNFKPVRTAELNLDEFKSSPKVTTTRNVRKQLWSVNKNTEKTSQIRRGTIMKSVKNRQTMNRTSAIQKQTTTKKQLLDNTIPLMDMEQFTVTKIKRTLFPAPSNIKYNQRKTSHIVTKLPIVASMVKQMNKPLPKIVITPTAKNVNKSVQTSKQKTVEKEKDKEKGKVKEKNEEKIDSIYGILVEINDKLNVIQPVLSNICVKLGMDDPFNTENHYNSLENVEHEPRNNLKKIVDETSNNLEKIEDKTRNILEKIEDQTINNLEKIDDETRNNLKKIEEETKNDEVEKTPNYIENCSTPINTIYKKPNESTIKLKKSWITQFEQIEKKLLNNSKDSVQLNSSPDDSPVAPFLNEIVSCMKKSQSTSNIPEKSHKKVLFKSKETDLMSESIYTYNELRNELPKFLSTPVNKTKDMNFMTPSVQGNEKKLISRRVQEQLYLLNDC